MILRLEIIVHLPSGAKHAIWGVTTVTKLASRINKVRDRGHEIGRVLTQKEYVTLIKI